MAVYVVLLCELGVATHQIQGDRMGIYRQQRNMIVFGRPVYVLRAGATKEKNFLYYYDSATAAPGRWVIGPRYVKSNVNAFGDSDAHFHSPSCISSEAPERRQEDYR